MSRSTKRKHVINELLNNEIRLPNEHEVLCRIVTSRGNNLHEVETSEGEVFLASMPNKFRRNIWVKQGDFILLERIDEGNKVKGEIASVLTRDHVKYYRSQGAWPEKFDASTNRQSQEADSDELQDNNSVADGSNEVNGDSSDSEENSNR